MKFLYLLLLILTLSIRSMAQENDDQNTPARGTSNEYIHKIIKLYFRSDPYQNGFGAFVKHLLKDPILYGTTMTKKSDTSLFYFQGLYKNFSPFGFLADWTQVRLSEKEFTTGDSTSLKDTLFVYQILGYSNKGKDGISAVKDEYSKFNRHYEKHFSVQFGDLKQGNDIVGGTTDYFLPGISGAPLSVSWLRMDDFQSAFIITLRFDVN